MLDCQKALFSLPPDLHYLNCGYMSPLPKTVEAAGVAGMRRKRDPAEISPAAFFDDLETARGLFAQIIGASDRSRIAVIPAVSYGLATAARNLLLVPGQNIVVVSGQFPSNVYVWRRMATEGGLELRTVTAPTRADGRAEEWNARLLEAVDRDTGLVALAQVHWTDGSLFDLAGIGARAREVGAALVVDGTQSVGAMPFDVNELKPDALICAAYKWLMGPYSIGAAYFGPRFDGGCPLEETWIGRQGSDDFRRLVDYEDDYRPGAVRYDVGETSNFILLPMLVAALSQVLSWKISAIQEYCRSLTGQLVADAAALGFGAERERWRAGHMVGLRMPRGLDPSLVSVELARRRVSVSVRGEMLRVSPYVYNDESDVAALGAALRGVVDGQAA
jgi:selenocysteine lyase/cysteine desulfurase